MWLIVQPAAPPPEKGSHRPPATEEEETHFEFYTILPNQEVVVPEPATRLTERRVRYLLQAGSFRRLDEADTLKARLALLGLEAKIESVTNGRGETWHRVRLGPYHTPLELARARRRLEKEDIQAIVLRLRESPPPHSSR